MTNRNDIGSNPIPAINIFVTPYCNMRCRFCFGKFEAEMSYSSKEYRELQFAVIQASADAGIEKVTFVGGEPLLYKWLKDEIAFAHGLGLCTCVVTNGYLVSEEWVQEVSPYLDWIGVSIDSVIPETNLISGRAVNGLALGEHDYRKRIEWVHKAGIKLKINTTVSRWNYGEDMTGFLRWASPDRVKMFQALQINGVNDFESQSFAVPDQVFHEYVERHISGGINVISETAADMKGSYLMVSPDGCFFENMHGNYKFSQPIQEVGYDTALSEVCISSDKFQERGGHYDWS